MGGAFFLILINSGKCVSFFVSLIRKIIPDMGFFYLFGADEPSFPPPILTRG